MLFELNIGLTDQSGERRSAGGYQWSLETFADACGIELAIVKSETIPADVDSDWPAEDTLWIRGKAECSQGDLIGLLKRLCPILSQDAIAVVIAGHGGLLAWNPGYEDERYQFASDYFRRPARVYA